MRKSYGMAFCLPSCFTTVSFESFSRRSQRDLQRVTSKVRISYVTQRNNTFLFLFDLFSKFTSELLIFLKEVTLISFFLTFYFQSLRSGAGVKAWISTVEADCFVVDCSYCFVVDRCICFNMK